MKMKTCQQCGRRRPRKKLNVSSAQHFTEIILCKDEVSCILTETGRLVDVFEGQPQKDIIFIDESMPVMNQETADTLETLLQAKNRVTYEGHPAQQAPVLE